MSYRSEILQEITYLLLTLSIKLDISIPIFQNKTVCDCIGIFEPFYDYGQIIMSSIHKFNS